MDIWGQAERDWLYGSRQANQDKLPFPLRKGPKRPFSTKQRHCGQCGIEIPKLAKSCESC